MWLFSFDFIYAIINRDLKKVVIFVKPLIGIVPLIDEKMDSYWMHPAYMDMVSYAGGIPFMLPSTNDLKVISEIVDKLDGFILAGGPDVNPRIYNEEKKDICGDIVVKRDELEIPLLIEVLKEKKPILGVCRGFQLMNAVLGGSLYQDIPTEFIGNVNHRQEKPYNDPCHNVNISGALVSVVNSDKIMVNSCHHQGIKDLSKHLEVVGRSDDGLIEAVSIKDYSFGLGIQWHPEMLGNKDLASVAIFKAFVNACKNE